MEVSKERVAKAPWMAKASPAWSRLTETLKSSRAPSYNTVAVQEPGNFLLRPRLRGNIFIYMMEGGIFGSCAAKFSSEDRFEVKADTSFVFLSIDCKCILRCPRHAGCLEKPAMWPQAHIIPDLGSDEVNYTVYTQLRSCKRLNRELQNLKAASCFRKSRIR